MPDINLPLIIRPDVLPKPAQANPKILPHIKPVIPAKTVPKAAGLRTPLQELKGLPWS